MLIILDLKEEFWGGAVLRGKFKVGDEIEIKPGFLTTREGKQVSKPICTKIESIYSGKEKLEEVIPGGSVAISTKLDPYVTKSDALVGQIASTSGNLEKPRSSLKFKLHLLSSIITSTQTIEVKPLVLSEHLMLIVNSFTTVGSVLKANMKQAEVKLLRPVMAFKQDRAVIFRKFGGDKWRIIGFGVIEYK